MFTIKTPLLHIAFLLTISLSLLTACGGAETPVQTEPALPTAAPSDIPPTPTSEPLAARINGEGLLLEDFNIELQLLQAGQQKMGNLGSPEEQKQQALDDLISNTLLAQEAQKAGQTFDETALQARADDLANQMGGADKLATWKQTMGFSDQAFMRALARNAEAAWQRDQIMAAVPETAEQVHVQQILVQDEAYANQLLDTLKNGGDFSTLAYQNDPTTGGELGWFPRGFIFHPEVEEAAFTTAPGSYSAVIHSSVGYHILYVIEKEPNRPLGPEARNALQKAAVVEWLKEKQSQSTIEILLP